MNRIPDDLPIREALPEVLRGLQASGAVVLKAPPGAGKTTGVPLALDTDQRQGRILLAQPRRLAARAAAARLAHLAKTSVGGRVGYQVRFDRRWSEQTRIVAVTTGILLRRLQSDSFLEGFDAVLLDEFHERSLEADLALGMLLQLKRTVRPELRLVVMSATLDPEPIADFLQQGGCPAAVVHSEGKSYPVDVRYAKQLQRSPIEQQVADVMPAVLRSSPGDVLIFLPGVGEIRKTQRLLKSMPDARDAEILLLYGDLPPAKQDHVLQPSSRRKIVLATNIAETSVTIPGVTAVVDSGLARVLRYDSDVGLPRLQVEPISTAAADQRAGRAGRTQPGVAWRLWPAAAGRGRPAYDTPEVLRSDLAGAVLQLAGFGELDVAAFPWLDPPAEEAVALAQTLLRRLGALDDGGITSLGRRMLAMPVHPRLARLLIAGEQLGVPARAAITAAMLGERDPFRGGAAASTIRRQDRRSSGQNRSPGPKRRAPAALGSTGRSDVVDRLLRLERFADGVDDEGVNQAAAKQVFRVAEQLAAMLEGGTGPQTLAGEAADEAIMRCLLAAYPDRLTRRRSHGSDRGITAGGKGVKLAGESKVRQGELFLAIDVHQSSGDARVRQASMVEADWLDPAGHEQRDECFFHPTSRQVVARRRTYWNGLLLNETPIENADPDQSQQLLFDQAVRQWDRVWPQDDDRLQQLVARVRCLRAWNPDLDLPALDQEQLQRVCFQLCRGRNSLQAVKTAPWSDYVLAELTFEQQQALAQQAPERMTVPSGNQIAIAYEEGKPPILAVRLQELFGWSETPRIAGGRVPLLLHLLAPNGRPQQVTDDLASFWQNTYSQVRKDLRRRYSKHHWPEDPQNAQATRRGLSRDAN